MVEEELGSPPSCGQNICSWWIQGDGESLLAGSNGYFQYNYHKVSIDKLHGLQKKTKWLGEALVGIMVVDMDRSEIGEGLGSTVIRIYNIHI